MSGTVMSSGFQRDSDDGYRTLRLSGPHTAIYTTPTLFITVIGNMNN